ncbi:hypothetical protein UPYG_G00264280 [Umbra pygmaea]|uniref:Uncharacterized protein n=1 Tax=Umbra pygmaea TaxID=75934 RepID=A0ABD0WVC9_UMBPY
MYSAPPPCPALPALETANCQSRPLVGPNSHPPLQANCLTRLLGTQASQLPHTTCPQGSSGCLASCYTLHSASRALPCLLSVIWNQPISELHQKMDEKEHEDAEKQG